MYNQPTILITEYNDQLRESIAKKLSSKYKIIMARKGEDAMWLLDKERVDLIIISITNTESSDLDQNDSADYLNIISAIKHRDEQIAILALLEIKKDNIKPSEFFSLLGNLETDALKRGADDCLFKLVNPETLELSPVLDDSYFLETISLKTEKLLHFYGKLYGLKTETTLSETETEFHGIVGRSLAMRSVFELIKQVCNTNSTVLITGESGTGKELVARAIHELSSRKDKPFVVVNCGALPEGVLESEIFGHEKGAFTGAVGKHKGKFEFAHTGTIFLDEIGELSLVTQVKLLRVLEQKEFTRVGGNENIKVDVRVIAATNRNLLSEVENRNFREDLYYRLKVITIALPPLRERKTDIPLLIEYYIQKFCAENNCTFKGISEKAMRALIAYHWPGNIRELKNVVENMVVFSSKKIVQPSDLPENITHRPALPQSNLIQLEVGLTMKDIEREAIIRTLESTGGNKVKTAKILGIGVRTLYRKMESYGLNS